MSIKVPSSRDKKKPEDWIHLGTYEIWGSVFSWNATVDILKVGDKDWKVLWTGEGKEKETFGPSTLDVLTKSVEDGPAWLCNEEFQNMLEESGNVELRDYALNQLKP
jgi:hypothetical protein